MGQAGNEFKNRGARMSAGTKTGNRHKPPGKGTLVPIENKHETGTLVPAEKETDPLPHQRRGADKGALVPTKTRSVDGLTAALLAPAHTGQAGQRHGKLTFSPDALGRIPTTAGALGRHALPP